MNSFLTTSFLRAARRAVLLSLLGALIAAPQLHAQLSGSFTIGSGGSYASFTAAVTALSTSGVSGPVTFNVINGSYNEQISIPQITGASASNTITFQSQSGIAANVTLFFTPTSTNNYVVRLAGADYVTFKNMTLLSQTGPSYGVVISLDTDAGHNSIVSNVITGIATASSGSTLADIFVGTQTVNNLTVTGNTFTNGAYAIYFVGNSTPHSAAPVISNNTMTDQGYGGAFFQYADDITFQNNTVTGSPSRGIELQYCNGGLQIVKNKFTNIGSGMGIYLFQVAGGTGFPTGPALVANNFVEIGSGSSGIDIYQSSNTNIYYNSINVVGGSSQGYYGYNNGATVNVENNNFVNTGGGYAVNFISSDGASTMNYNNLFTVGNFVGRYGSTELVDLAAWQSASSKDANSVANYPSFTSATNLHTGSPWLNAKGTPVAEVTDDIDGNARNGSTPDIGADEFTPVAGAPLSGAYTLGATGTYLTFTAAVNDLLLRGVSGPVTFNVQTAQYNEHIVIYNIPGASASNTVTFQAATGNAANVTLYYFSADAPNNYVVYLQNADFIRFHKMTLRSNNTVSASYGIVFYLYGNVDNLTLDTCTVSGTPTASSSANYSIVYGSSAVTRNFTANGTTFNDGGYAIQLVGYNTSITSTNCHITNCTFNNQDYAGIYLQYQTDVVATGNTITNPVSRGIELQYCYGSTQVLYNKITAVNGGNGIYLYQCTGGTGFPTGPGFVANNFIQAVGSTNGIDIYQSNYENVYNNSVNITGGSSTAYYGYNNGATVNVVNNNFANTGGGYAVNFASSDGGTMNYNNLYTIGNFVARYGSTEIVDLPAWQSASGQDANSVAYYPSFTSATNLHTGSPWLNAKGTPLVDITDDIDGNPRDGSTPDIGADEFTPVSGAPLSGAYTLGASGVYTTFTAAVNDLLLRGVSGPVTFNVQTAQYNEHLVIYNIPGASASNTVTFQAATGNAANVTLYYFSVDAPNNYVVYLLNADFIRFHKMTLRSNNNVSASYGIVFYLSGNINNLTVDSCTVSGTPTASSSANYSMIYGSGSVTRNFTANGTTFNDGGYAIQLVGYNTAITSTNSQVTNCTFNNQDYAGIYLQYQTDVVASHNTITNPVSRGIELEYCYGSTQVLYNKITSVNGGNGIYLYQCTGGTGFPTGPGLVANNFVEGTTSTNGIDIYQSNYENVFNNSVNINGPSSAAYYGYNNATGVTVENNNFANTGGGYAVNFASSDGATAMDNNNLYTVGNFVARYGSTELVDLPAWQAATGKDLASVSYNPAFVSTTNLHTASNWLNAKGIPLVDVTDDIDGNPRDGSTPDIGADEYTPDPLMTPMAGTYTIGAAAANYATFHAANNALLLRGVSGAVTFNVQPATYQESIVFYPVPNASDVNTITFQSQNGIAAGTTLYSVTTIDSNYVMFLTGADHIHFSKMSFRSNNNVGATYGLVAYLWGNVDDFSIQDCIINGTSVASSSANYSLVYASASLTRNMKLIHNIFNDGGYAVYSAGYNTSILSTGTQILNNTFNNPDYAGVYLQYHDAPRVNNNTVVNADGRGIELDYCMNALEMKKNRIVTDGSSAVGLYLYFCTGGSLSPGITSNNFVSCLQTSSTGIYLYGSNYQDIVNNSVNMTAASSNGFYTYQGSSNSNTLVNNIFANPGGGYSVNVQSPEGLGVSNYNDHYSSGTTLAYWAGARTALSDLQSASGKEANSKAAFPAYYSATNLHSISPQLDSAGTPLGEVTDDIDGDVRDGIKPDIGADEYSVIVTLGASIPGGWNMISLPLAVTDSRKTVLFPTSISNAFAYAPPAGYVVKDSVATMLGYWLKFPSTQTVNVTGAPDLKDSVSARAGWNLIGSIAVPMPKTAIIQNPVGNVISNYFEYVPGVGYIVADTLKPGRAFWVKTTAVGTLMLDVTAILPKPLVAEAEDILASVRGLNELRFRGVDAEAGAPGASLYFGMKTGGQSDLDRYSLPPAPPTEAADVRFSSGRFVELLSGTESGEIPISVQGAGTSFVMSWTMKEAQSRAYILVERTGAVVSREVRLRGTGTTTITSGKRYAIRIQELPTAFALLQNYPNPFNPTTSVRFDLPEASVVTLTVYTMLGQEMTVPLQSVQLDRGTHEVSIDARTWSSGTYMYRIQALDSHGRAMNATRKMVLLK